MTAYIQPAEVESWVRSVQTMADAAVHQVPVSQHKMRAEAAEFIPMFTSFPQAVEANQKQKRQMPPATNEEWEARIAKREKEVITIKSLQSYRMYVEVFPHDKRSEDDPQTPDPRDRKVSKRMWKWNVEKWRLHLKSRCVYSRAVALQCREYLRRQEQQEAEDVPIMARLRTEPVERLQGSLDATVAPSTPSSNQVRESAPSGSGKFQ